MPPIPAPPAAIVIAGGRSSRFGDDKLHARIDGLTLRERTLAAVRGSNPVVLVTASDTAAPGASVTVSEYPRWGGPCAAIAAGVAALPDSATDVVIVAADLGHPEVALSVLLGIDSGILADADGRAQWLLARAPVAALRQRIAALEAAGGTAGRSARAALGDLGLPLVPASDDAVADIDERPDLDRLKEQN